MFLNGRYVIPDTPSNPRNIYVPGSGCAIACRYDQCHDWWQQSSSYLITTIIIILHSMPFSCSLHSFSLFTPFFHSFLSSTPALFIHFPTRYSFPPLSLTSQGAYLHARWIQDTRRHSGDRTVPLCCSPSRSLDILASIVSTTPSSCSSLHYHVNSLFDHCSLEIMFFTHLLR